METTTAFQTKQLRVMIDDMSMAGSAFGSCENGETVFFNQRIVSRVCLEVGEIVETHVIPNYEDKRPEVPWRAVKVIRGALIPDEVRTIVPADPVKSSSELDEEIMRLLQMPDAGIWTTGELAEDVGTDVKVVGNSCVRLFNASRIAKAEVHGAPNQSRSSFRLWGINKDVFR